MDVNWIIIFIVFFITNTLCLLRRALRVRQEPQGLLLAHDDELASRWTVHPAIVLIGIIIYGLSIWNRVRAFT